MFFDFVDNLWFWINFFNSRNQGMVFILGFLKKIQIKTTSSSKDFKVHKELVDFVKESTFKKELAV
jgi:hypothetical protein